MVQPANRVVSSSNAPLLPSAVPPDSTAPLADLFMGCSRWLPGFSPAVNRELSAPGTLPPQTSRIVANTVTVGLTLAPIALPAVVGVLAPPVLGLALSVGIALTGSVALLIGAGYAYRWDNTSVPVARTGAAAPQAPRAYNLVVIDFGMSGDSAWLSDFMGHVNPVVMANAGSVAAPAPPAMILFCMSANRSGDGRRSAVDIIDDIAGCFRRNPQLQNLPFVVAHTLLASQFGEGVRPADAASKHTSLSQTYPLCRGEVDLVNCASGFGATSVHREHDWAVRRLLDEVAASQPAIGT